MAARSVTIGDGLVSWLNDVARAWPLAFTAVRTYEAAATLEGLDDALLVELVPPAEPEAEEAMTRGTESQDYPFLLGVRERYSSSGAIAASWVDARVELVELIADALPGVFLSGMGSGFQVWCESTRPAPLWDPESLRDQRTFLGVVEILMREHRPK